MSFGQELKDFVGAYQKQSAITADQRKSDLSERGQAETARHNLAAEATSARNSEIAAMNAGANVANKDTNIYGAGAAGFRATINGGASAPVPAHISALTSDPTFQRMLAAESSGHQTGPDGQPLTSPKGALGVAQVMPGTAPEAAKLAGLAYDDNLYRTDARYNATIGEAYYKQQLKTFGSPDVAAAAYNAGPGRVQQALAKAQSSGGSYLAYLPAETQNYVARVTGGGAPAPARVQASAIPPVGPAMAGGAIPDPNSPNLTLRNGGMVRTVHAADGGAMTQPDDPPMPLPRPPELTPGPPQDLHPADPAPQAIPMQGQPAAPAPRPAPADTGNHPPIDLLHAALSLPLVLAQGLGAIIKHHGLDGGGGALPDPNTVAAGRASATAYPTDPEAAKDVNSVRRIVDPHNELDDQMSSVAGLHAVYKHFEDTGQQDKAANAAGLLIEKLKYMSQAYGTAALQAAKAGRYGDAATLLAKSYDNVPNGERLVTTQPDASGNGTYATVNPLTHHVTSKGAFGPAQLIQIAGQQASGAAYYKHLSSVAALSDKSKKGQDTSGDAAVMQQMFGGAGASPAGASGVGGGSGAGVGAGVPSAATPRVAAAATADPDTDGDDEGDDDGDGDGAVASAGGGGASLIEGRTASTAPLDVGPPGAPPVGSNGVPGYPAPLDPALYGKLSKQGQVAANALWRQRAAEAVNAQRAAHEAATADAKAQPKSPKQADVQKMASEMEDTLKSNLVGMKDASGAVIKDANEVPKALGPLYHGIRNMGIGIAHANAMPSDTAGLAAIKLTTVDPDDPKAMDFITSKPDKNGKITVSDNPDHPTSASGLTFTVTQAQLDQAAQLRALRSQQLSKVKKAQDEKNKNWDANVKLVGRGLSAIAAPFAPSTVLNPAAPQAIPFGKASRGFVRQDQNDGGSLSDLPRQPGW